MSIYLNWVEKLGQEWKLKAGEETLKRLCGGDNWVSMKKYGILCGIELANEWNTQVENRSIDVCRGTENWQLFIMCVVWQNEDTWSVHKCKNKVYTNY